MTTNAVTKWMADLSNVKTYEDLVALAQQEISNEQTIAKRWEDVTDCRSAGWNRDRKTVLDSSNSRVSCDLHLGKEPENRALEQSRVLDENAFYCGVVVAIISYVCFLPLFDTNEHWTQSVIIAFSVIVGVSTITALEFMMRAVRKILRKQEIWEDHISERYSLQEKCSQPPSTQISDFLKKKLDAMRQELVGEQSRLQATDREIGTHLQSLAAKRLLVEARIARNTELKNDTELLLEARDEIDRSIRQSEEARGIIADRIARITASMDECAQWIQGPLSDLEILTDVANLVSKTNELTQKAESAVIASMETLRQRLVELEQVSIAIADGATRVLAGGYTGDVAKDIEQMERAAKMGVGLELTLVKE
ncbi:hypothetical protein HYV73_02420 [Candidatus Uhrbacteria bacterium]|nr:hypothetical protein [Candidatus Uhrbacteria bacterium]